MHNAQEKGRNRKSEIKPAVVMSWSWLDGLEQGAVFVMVISDE